MFDDAKHNTPPSATTSATPANRAEPGEEAILTAEMAAARRAIERTLTTLRADAGRLADPTEWARTHPLMTVGAALAAGIAAAGAVVPRRNEHFVDHLERMFAHARPGPVPSNASASAEGSAQPQPGAIVGMVLELAKTAITQLIVFGGHQAGAAMRRGSPSDVGTAAQPNTAPTSSSV